MLLVLLLLSGLLALSCGGPVKRVPTCPHIRCATPTCPIPIPNYIVYNGEICIACYTCPQGKKRRAKKPPLVICPVCALPLCSGPYEMTYFEVNGKQCPGCPVCPEGDGLDPVELLTVEEPTNVTRAV